MKFYEMARRGLEPVLPPLYKRVRKNILSETDRARTRLRILDVGGRKSPYSIGVPAGIHLLDLPRSTELQSELNLGVNDEMVDQIRLTRSNVERVILGDMTCSGLPSDHYDMVVSVEVLEHVEEDRRFVSEVCRVLKPGGVFLMTTPNGDFVENHNPDHKRHYKRQQLDSLLRDHFEDVNVEYAIAGGYFRKLGLRSWSARRPVWTLSSMVGNIVNSVESNRANIAKQGSGTHHLIARAKKSEAVADIETSKRSVVELCAE